MTDIDSILHRIRGWVAAKHGRKAIITRETGLRPNTLSSIADPTWNPSADTIRKIEAAIAAQDSLASPAPPQP